MDFSKYTTQELDFIVSNFGNLKRELKKRRIKESGDFLFKSGDVVHKKINDDNFILKIKEIDKRNNTIIADEIVIRDCGQFEAYVDEWFSINGDDGTEWHEYVKIEDSEIFENLLNIIDKFNDEIKQLEDNTYLKLKNEIAPYDN